METFLVIKGAYENHFLGSYGNHFCLIRFLWKPFLKVTQKLLERVPMRIFCKRFTQEPLKTFSRREIYMPKERPLQALWCVCRWTTPLMGKYKIHSWSKVGGSISHRSRASAAPSTLCICTVWGTTIQENCFTRLIFLLTISSRLPTQTEQYVIYPQAPAGKAFP